MFTTAVLYMSFRQMLNNEASRATLRSEGYDCEACTPCRLRSLFATLLRVAYLQTKLEAQRVLAAYLSFILGNRLLSNGCRTVQRTFADTTATLTTGAASLAMLARAT